LIVIEIKQTILSPECETMLEANDLYAELAVTLDRVLVMNEMGERLFIVSPTIHAQDLCAIIQHGIRQRALGERLGAEGVRQSMRAVLGVRELPQVEL